MPERGFPDPVTLAALERLTSVARLRLCASSAVLCDRQGRALASAVAVAGDPEEVRLLDLCRTVLVAVQPVSGAEGGGMGGAAAGEAKALGVGVSLGLPVSDGAGRLMGAIAVGAPAPRAWSAREVASLRGLAVIIARELKRPDDQDGRAARPRLAVA